MITVARPRLLPSDRPRVPLPFGWGLLLVILLAGKSAGATTAHTVTVRGKRVRIVCHFDAKKVGEAVLPFAEEAVKVTSGILSLDPNRLTKPLVVHLYRTVKAYREVEATLTKGAFAKNDAFSSYKTRSAYIALVPECSDANLDRFGPGNVVLRQVAHETAHLTVYALVPGFRHLPDWFAEGLATNVADRVMVLEGKSPGAATAPFSSTRMVLAKALLRDQKLPNTAAIFSDHLEGLGRNQKYAVWWLFFRFLRQHEAKRVGELIESVISMGDSAAFAKELEQAEREIWPGPGLSRLSLEFRKYVAGLHPRWELVYRSLDVLGDTLVERAYADFNSIAWRTVPAKSSRFVIRAVIEIPASPDPQMNVLLGRSPEGFVSVTFRAGYGVTVFDHRTKGNRWIRLAAVKVNALRTDVRLPVTVAVEGEEIRVSVGGTEVLRTVAKGRDLSGPRGLGVQSGGIGIWHGCPI